MGAAVLGSVLVDRRLVLLSILLLSGWITFLSSRLAELKEVRPNQASASQHELSEVRMLHRSFKQVEAEQVIQEEERQTLKLEPETEAKRSAPEFILVTGERSSACRTSQGSFILMKSYKNKVDYCNSHGCRVWYSLETWNPDFRGTWARYPVLKQLMLLNPQVQWFMWMDGDAIFTDLSFPIPFHDYENRDLVVPGYWDKVYGENPDWVGLNAGVFLIRNSNWSLKFLDEWMELGKPENSETARRKINAEIPSRPQEWAPDDQSALLYLLRHLSSSDRDRTYLELRYCLHGYWEMLMNTLETSSSKPFVTHFCGCSFCGNSHEISPKCISSFERAYNFADNQLLQRVRVRHLNLNSADVVLASKII